MKKVLSVLLVATVLCVYGVFALASGSSETSDQGSGKAEAGAQQSNLGEYSVDIVSCRLSKDYEGDPVVIVKYTFTNNSDEAAAFDWTFEDTVYQDGVGLNKAYVLADSANYDEGNQTKKIKSNTSLDVEVAYELNDTATDITIEVKELFSFDDDTVTKTFSIA